MTVKVRRVARHLTDEFPEITQERARDRAQRLLTRHPRLSTGYAGEALVRGERTARMYEQLVWRLRGPVSQAEDDK
jgi:hypothetical protein